MTIDHTVVALLAEASLEEVGPLLQHLAWRSLLEGGRVRRHCADLSTSLRGLDAPTLLKLRTALATPPLSLLYPLVRFPSHPHFPFDPLPSPPPLLFTAAFGNVTKNQVIDALVKASRDTSSIQANPLVFKNQVLELCLDNIGKRWRVAHTTNAEDDLVESIGRKLNEIEFEVKIQGDHFTVQSHVRPIIHELRFLLGLCTSTQIVRRLNAFEDNTPVPRDSDPSRLFSAWITIRLMAGVPPVAVVDDLASVKGTLKYDGHRSALSDTLTSFGLTGRKKSKAEHDEFGTLSPSPLHSLLGSPGLPSSPKKLHAPPHRHPSVNGKSTFKWWSHKRNSSSSKVLNKARLIETDRRPSLPLVSPSAVSVVSHFHSPLGPWRESTSSLGSSASLTRVTSMSRSTDSLTATELASSIEALDSPERAKWFLIDHLLLARYRVTGQAKNDWFLGQGKFNAGELLDSLEARLGGRTDSDLLPAMLSDVRALFGLVTPGRGSQKPLDNSNSSTPVDDPEPPSSIRRYGSTPSSAFHYRDASFDLDQYLCDITPSTDGHDNPPPQCQHPRVYVDLVDSTSVDESLLSEEKDWEGRPRRKSSVGSSIATSQAQSQIFHGASRMSSFVIQEATREFAHESFATSVRLSSLSLKPRRVSSMVDLKVDVAPKPLVELVNLNRPWPLTGGLHNSSPPGYTVDDRPTPTISFPSIRRGIKGKGEIASRPSAWEMNRKSRPPPLPIATPTLPSVGLHDLPSPHIGIFGDLETPPQTPPCPAPKRLLDNLTTPRQLRIRKSHREWTIVDGTQMSPPRGVDLDSPVEGYATAPNTPGLPVTPSVRDLVKPLPSVPIEPPTPPSLTISPDTEGVMDTVGTPLLARLFSFFEAADGVYRVRCDLETSELDSLLRKVTKCCDGHIALWILDQMSKMAIHKQHSEVISRRLASLQSSSGGSSAKEDLAPSLASPFSISGALPSPTAYAHQRPLDDADSPLPGLNRTASVLSTNTFGSP